MENQGDRTVCESSLSIPSSVILEKLQLTLLAWKRGHPVGFKQGLTLSQPFGFLTVNLTLRISIAIKLLNVKHSNAGSGSSRWCQFSSRV